jgi:thioredoxin 2
MELIMSNAVDAVIYICSSCGAQNRIPQTRVGDDPICGRCKNKIFPRHPVEVTDSSFSQQVEHWPLPVLVDFWAPWCGPCQILAPVLEGIAKERGGQLKIAKVNVDENPNTAGRFGVRSIPTMLLMRGPIVLAQFVGAMTKSSLDSQLARYLSVN